MEVFQLTLQTCYKVLFFFALSLHMPHMKGSRFLSKMKSDFTERNTTFLESLKIFLNGRLHREKRLENVTFSTKCLLIV